MSLGIFQVPDPVNEPVRAYPPGSAERASLKAELERQAGLQIEVPLVIGGERVTTGNTENMVMPHDHGHVLGKWHQAGDAEVDRAIRAATDAKPAWAAMPFEDRAAIFLRAARLLETRHRDLINASTMLGQSKTAHQAEIDAAVELIDFLRFNVHYLQEIMREQPISAPGDWNRVEYRPLDGFVFAISPFNFTAIAGNLPAAPAMCGNTVVWKPSAASMLSNHYLMEIFEESGLPPGVINFVPGPPAAVAERVIAHPDLAGVHFTGSTQVFQNIWATVGKNIARYDRYPRVVGETGGKDFIFAHESADIEPLVVGTIRAAFEYQGQKCSAASRMYVPDTIWKEFRERLVAQMETIAMGDVRDFRNLMSAVIHKASFDKLSKAIEEAKSKVGGDVAEVIGGDCDDSKGWFVSPTVIVANDPKYRTMCEELFGPVLTIHVYDAKKYEETLDLCNDTSVYALTGGVFASDRAAGRLAVDKLRYAAGNFYVNDKPTGSIVGQQPFGGSRASGTNDKAGSMWNIIRWLSPRTIKESFDPPRDYRYPSMAEE